MTTTKMARFDDIPLRGRRTRLAPPTRAFVDQLYQLAAVGEIPWQWRGPETPRSFEDSLWDGVLVQFAVEDVRTGRSVGLLRADNVHVFHGYAYVTMMLLPEYRFRAWPLEAALLFGNYLFRRFNLQHLYAETPEAYLQQFRSGVGRFFEVEGRLRNRVLINGQRQDLYILTFDRERALTDGAALLDRLTGPAVAAAERARL